ncbi:hypothetical protein WJX74_010727 [Apatococcus lobatus]|uniref:Major facilitator superfamily (MFS) profile domain-containing protein n=1 Tax=Apatococcus lobatus TaxID=904363 RepID=A0AAW1S0H7_9CHLO
MRSDGDLTVQLLLACCLTGLGAVVIGYNGAVVGGVSAMVGYLHQFFPEVLAQEAAGSSVYCRYNDQKLQLVVASLYLSGIVSALPSAYLVRRLGRIGTLRACGPLFILGIVLQSGAQDRAMLVLGGLVAGAASTTTNIAIIIYSAEMAPPRLRARMGFIYQAAVSLGVVIAQGVNAGTQDMYPWGWRLSIALAAIPACLFLVSAWLLPDTPTSLIARGQHDLARKVLQWVRQQQDVDKELAMHEAEASLTFGSPCTHSSKSLLELTDMTTHSSFTALQPDCAVHQSATRAGLSCNDIDQLVFANQIEPRKLSKEHHFVSLSNVHCLDSIQQQDAVLNMQQQHPPMPKTASASTEGLSSAAIGRGRPASTQLPGHGSFSPPPSASGLPGSQLCRQGPSKSIDSVADYCSHLHEQPSSPESHDRQPLSHVPEASQPQQQVLQPDPASPAESPKAGYASLRQSECSGTNAQDVVTCSRTREDATQHVQQRVAWHTILARRNRPQLLLPAACTFFQIWSGFIIMCSFAPQLLVSMGFQVHAAQMLAIGQGVVNHISVYPSMWLSDRYGRRSMLIIPSAIMLACQASIGIVLAVASPTHTWVAWLGVALFYAFSAAFNMSWGPIGNLYPAEICTLETRATCQAIAVLGHNLWSFVVGQTFLTMLCSLRWGLFLFFSAWMIVAMLMVYLLFPETKNVPLPETRKLFSDHWFWQRFATSSTRLGTTHVAGH